MKEYRKQFLFIFSITLVIGLFLFGILFGGAVLGFWGSMGEMDIEALTLRQNSILVYTDPETGEERELQQLNAEENREWVSIDDIPKDLQHAFVSIEDERFYKHNGFDLRRTGKATLSWLGRKLTGKSGVSLGGSTITQQLIKNMTGEREQVAARKIQEIARAVYLEKQMEKDQILELYLNCIYLSQGCNGVQTASKIYFDKDVKDLSLAESASIAGITQYPSLYDPLVNPDKNKERQKMVLGKMLELEYITKEQYDTAVTEELKFTGTSGEKNKGTGAHSYFVDQVIRDVLKDMQDAGYSETLAKKMIYSGGMKIYTTYNPVVQEGIDKYFENPKNFPLAGAQSAVAILDVSTGAVKGMAGGIGEKEGSLTLNRASQSLRPPGSSIKPIAVYAPAIEKGIIAPGDVYQDVKKSYGDWSPKNADNNFRGPVDIRWAVRSSLNTIAVQVLDKLGAQNSYEFLRDKMGITSLVEARDINGTIYSDIGYSQLGLGGLTDGVSVLEMAAAYATFANEGIYNRPYVYTEAVDKDGNLVIASQRESHEAMSAQTAFLMTRLLNEVVTSGTGGGAGVSGYFTGGKTGTTDDNKDRWFVGFTPYYAAAVWYGYDIPQVISGGSNPCVPAFRSVMNYAHKSLPGRRSIAVPSGVVQISYCTETGKRAGETCPAESYYYSKKNLPGSCSIEHPPEEEEGAEGEGIDPSTTPAPDGANNGTTPTNTAKPDIGALEE